MLFQTKHFLMMIALLLISVALLIFVPDELNQSLPLLSDSNHQSINISPSENKDIEGRFGGIVVILAKVMIAVIFGNFALFCVCSRLGFCLSKRNKAILTTTYSPSVSADT